jgi:hypothetical protein
LKFAGARWLASCQSMFTVDLTDQVEILELPSSCGAVSFGDGTAIDRSTAVYSPRIPDNPKFSSATCSPDHGGYFSRSRLAVDVDSIPEALPASQACMTRSQLETLVQVEARVTGKFSTSGAVVQTVDVSLSERLDGWMNFALANLLSPQRATCTVVKNVTGQAQTLKCLPAAGVSDLALSDFEQAVHLISPVRLCP